MKKVFCFIPAILYLIFIVLFLGMGVGAGSLEPIAYSIFILFVVSGVLLSCRKWWGALIGVLPGIYFIYTSMFWHGQIINELPVGIAIILFYLLAAVLQCRGKSSN